MTDNENGQLPCRDIRYLIEHKLAVKKFIGYFRDYLKENRSRFSGLKKTEATKVINFLIRKKREKLLTSINNLSEKGHFLASEKLDAILSIFYASYVVNIEERNSCWAYDYMSISRRIGELWEPFCQLCWKYAPIQNIELWAPPRFNDIKLLLQADTTKLIKSLPIESIQKNLLLSKIDSTWELVSSGAIQLKSDLHFELDGKKYVVDFKSGFNSNEKGNTNRLLTVAKIYKSLGDDYQCLLLVRSSEEENNHYLKTLKRSGLWTVFSGRDTYFAIQQFTGFDLFAWIVDHVNWEQDLVPQTAEFLREKDLLKYLKW